MSFLNSETLKPYYWKNSTKPKPNRYTYVWMVDVTKRRMMTILAFSPKILQRYSPSVVSLGIQLASSSISLHPSNK